MTKKPWTRLSRTQAVSGAGTAVEAVYSDLKIETGEKATIKIPLLERLVTTFFVDLDCDKNRPASALEISSTLFIWGVIYAFIASVSAGVVSIKSSYDPASAIAFATLCYFLIRVLVFRGRLNEHSREISLCEKKTVYYLHTKISGSYTDHVSQYPEIRNRSVPNWEAKEFGKEHTTFSTEEAVVQELDTVTETTWGR